MKADHFINAFVEKELLKDDTSHDGIAQWYKDVMLIFQSSMRSMEWPEKDWL